MIVMMTGKKRSGKDTAAQIIKDAFPKLDFERIALADAMKEFTCELLGYQPQIVESLKEAENVPFACFDATATMRQFLQTLGQGVKDITGDDLVWCRYLAYQLDLENKNYVLTDVRFPFEQKFFTELAKIADTGVLTIKIEREGIDNDDSHISEQNFDKIPYDVVITNNSTLEELETRLRHVFKNYMLGVYDG